MYVGKNVPRVDALEKVTGRAKYVADLVGKDALIAKLVHADIPHGRVVSFDLSEAEKIPGVVKIITCFDVPENYYGTAGHPYALDSEAHTDCDRLMLESHVRYYGDPVAVVIARDGLAATRGVKAIRVNYEEYPFYLDPLEAMKLGAAVIQEAHPDNICGHTLIEEGDLQEAISEAGLIYVDRWYRTPTVQHTFIENHSCYAYMEKGRIVVVTSTQIPHILQRIVGQALGLPWGKIRIVKPYVGGGFGGKQDALNEPLCAYLTTQVGGRKVYMEMTREETFMDARVRHAIIYHMESWVRQDGTLAARRMTSYANQGGYTSHGHTIAMKGAGGFPQIYQSAATVTDTYTVFTNIAAGGAMRGYGMPQFAQALESHMDDIAAILQMDPIAFRLKNLIPVGYEHAFTQMKYRDPSYEQCIEKGKAYVDWDAKRTLYANQKGPVRRGLGMALLFYNSGAYPYIIEISSCRMVLNQDGTITVAVGETEIGQGADTAFTQLAADAVGLPVSMVHVITVQDTDVTPYGLGAYASRQSYVVGRAIYKAGRLLREKILRYAHEMTGVSEALMDIVEGQVLRTDSGETLLGVDEVAVTSYYSEDHAEQITAEVSEQCKDTCYTLGVCFAEVEVDIPLCKVKVLKMINVHDCGRLINPALAEAQVHGGMSMALGYGLGEVLRYDEKTGCLLNGNLLDYKILTTMDHPELEAQFVENPEPTNPYGTKGLGEPPAIPGAAAIRNAVLQATGIAFDENPLTPERLFEQFTAAGLFEEVAEDV